MDNILSVLYRGKNILIPRSDGRTNFATISSVDFKAQTVTVEWFENNDSKGKEIMFADVFAQNPHLKNEKNSNNNMGEGDAATNNTAEENDKKRTTQLNKTTNNKRSFLPRGSLSDYQSKQNSYTSYEKLSTQRPITNSSANVAIAKNRARISLMPPASFSDTNIQSQKRPARGSVVAEVEKLKKNREERRLRQAEAREEQKALMKIYPKNPNWKFAKMIRDYQCTLEFTPLTGEETVESYQITVCVRKRPLNKREVTKNEIDVISVPKKDAIIVHEPRNKVDLTKYLDNQRFYFDYVFDEHCSNETVYKYTAKPLIKTIFDGGMATCFAYGQTGSGKTHTMGGNFAGKRQDLDKGIYMMVAKDVFDYINAVEYSDRKFIVTSTFFEIYQGKVFDLLAKKAKLRVLEDGKQQVQVVGLTEKVVTSPDTVLALLKLGNSARTSGKTTANSNSSRSHAVFQIVLRQAGNRTVYGKFSLIDLAGNERGADTSTANRVTQMEGAEINKSLLALKECIRALGRKGAHLPFRQSKLTQVLRDSFVGEKSRTCMIAMISPGMCSCEHTLNTLRYADRVKELISSDKEEKYNVIQSQDSQDLFNELPTWHDLDEDIVQQKLSTLDESTLELDGLLPPMDITCAKDISISLTAITENEEQTFCDESLVNELPQQI